MSILNTENYFIRRRHRLLGQTTKQTLRNLSPENPKSIGNYEG